MNITTIINNRHKIIEFSNKTMNPKNFSKKKKKKKKNKKKKKKKKKKF